MIQLAQKEYGASRCQYQFGLWWLNGVYAGGPFGWSAEKTATGRWRVYPRGADVPAVSMALLFAFVYGYASAPPAPGVAGTGRTLIATAIASINAFEVAAIDGAGNPVDSDFALLVMLPDWTPPDPPAPAMPQ